MVRRASWGGPVSVGGNFGVNCGMAVSSDLGSLIPGCGVNERCFTSIDWDMGASSRKVSAGGLYGFGGGEL